MNTSFDLRYYYFRDEEHHIPLDITFWAGIDELNEIGIVTPKRKSKLGWPKRLKDSFNIDEHIYYDPEIVGLPLILTKEQIENAKTKISDLVGSLVSIDPEEALDTLKMELVAQRSAHEFLCMIGKNEKPIEYNEWQVKVLSWRRGYGFLVPHNQMKGLLFPVPSGDDSLKHEIVREYFFHIKPKMFLDPYFSGIVLSVAQEPNTDRAIYGFRRDFATDWIFSDKRFIEGEYAKVGGIYADGEVQGGRYVNLRPFAEEINYLVSNLEDILSS